MLITLDLGNTSISAGIFSAGKPVAKSRFLYSTFPNNIKKWVNGGGYKLDSAIFCSVNPRFSSILKSLLREFVPGNRIIQLRNSHIPIENRYKNKNQAGIDRLVNVFGGGKIYGFPCLVIDIGTAITFDLGSPKGAFEGGLIFAGPNLAFNALQTGTAKIGKFPLKFSGKRSLIGRNTRECVIEGIASGYGNIIRGLIGEFKRYSKRKWKMKLRVLVTGGYINVIKPYLSKDDHCDEFLTLKAMAHLYNIEKVGRVGRRRPHEISNETR